MTPLIINSDATLSSALGDIRELYNKHKYLKIKLQTGKDRSLDWNGQIHFWYNQLALELKEDDALGHKCYCKLHHGVPILRVEDEDFRAFYDLAIKGLSYEKKLQAMKYIPVTSIMSQIQIAAYGKAMQDDFAARPEGVILAFKLVVEGCHAAR